MAADSTYRAAAIGRTGAGNYGHGLHQPFVDLDNIAFVAIADPDEEGRREQMEATGVQKGYTDFREMLEKEKPDLVTVGPRWTDCHLEMVLACIDAGAHVYCEKPMTWNLEEGDQIVAAAAAAGRKVAVAHQGVYLPVVQGVKAMIADGRLGKLRALYAHGKQDRRGGGEDMIVLGTHAFNTMRCLSGDVAWMSAHVMADGHELTTADIAEPTEPVGPVAGDCINSYFAFANGVVGSFDSRRNGATGGAVFGIEIVGSEGRIWLRGGGDDTMIYSYPDANPADLQQQWQPLEEFAGAHLQGDGNRLAILDLITCIEQDRKPISSAEDAVAALEMILGAYEAQITGGRVTMPMTRRQHPLVAWPEGAYGG